MRIRTLSPWYVQPRPVRRGGSISQRPKYPHRGGSTAFPATVAYRLGKLWKRGLLKGDWLDCGCAEGDYTVALLEGGARRVVGIDIEESRIDDARRRHHTKSGAEFLWARSEELPFTDDSFDGVFCNEVFEHVDDEILTLREFRRVLRPSGHLVLMSPNRLFPFEGHGLRFTPNFGIRGPLPLIPWLPAVLTQRFVEARNYWPWHLRRLIEGHGFDVVEMGTALPVFEAYRWLPEALIDIYQRHITVLETVPLLRHLGVSRYLLLQ